jgi:hypothetical protein
MGKGASGPVSGPETAGRGVEGGILLLAIYRLSSSIFRPLDV